MPGGEPGELERGHVTFEEFVNLLERNDGQDVTVWVNAERPLTGMFSGQLWHEKSWHHVDGPGEEIPDGEIHVIIGCQVGDVREAGSVLISKKLYEDAWPQRDACDLVVETLAGPVHIENETALAGLS